jgi:flavin-dependent dehydrogenase
MRTKEHGATTELARTMGAILRDLAARIEQEGLDLDYGTARTAIDEDGSVVVRVHERDEDGNETSTVLAAATIAITSK